VGQRGHFPKYRIKILLGNFNAKMGRGDIFIPTVWNNSLHQDINDNGVRIENFVTSKNLVVKSTTFPHRNIHKYTGPLLMGRLTTRLITFWQIGDGTRVYLIYDLSGELTVTVITV